MDPRQRPRFSESRKNLFHFARKQLKLAHVNRRGIQVTLERALLERLEEEALAAFGKLVGKRAARTQRKLSAVARSKIAAAQRARWAKLKGR